MGSTSHSCEIQEDQSRREHTQGMHQSGTYRKEGQGGQKHPLLKPVATERDDIDQLFKSINLRGPRSSLGKSFDDGSSPFRKSSMKKPIRAGAPFSPASEISEQVTLKQALRGLCISQASEMAAMKRLSKSVNNSPRISEAGKIKSLYKSVLVETGECSKGVGDMADISVVPEGNSASTSLDRGTHTPQELLPPSRHPSVNSSPRHSATPGNLNPLSSGECSKGVGDMADISVVPEGNSASTSLDRGTHTPQELLPPSRHPSVNSSPRHSATPSNLNPLSSGVGKKTLKEELAQIADHENEEVPASKSYQFTTEDSAAAVDAASKASLAKFGQKSKQHNVPLSPNAVNVKRLTKLSRKSPRLVKPGSRKRIIAKKRLDHESSPSSGTSTNNEVESVTMHSTVELVCQRCQCALKSIDKKTDQGPAESHFGSAGAKLSLSCATPDTSGVSFTSSACSSRILGEANKSSKEKGEFSQSSKSSLGDYSTTTSISDDSNLSRSSCSNRPHMSKDVRWEAIRHAKRQHGTLGLKNFNLLKKLGCGDIGTVYLAELVGTNYPFAIKVMDNEYLAKRKKMPRARAEREILRMLDHPFLPTLYAQFTSDNLSCLVMEYCPGGDLHVLRQKQPGRNFTEPAARFYVAEVLLALEYLHMLGVVYRDLKPENILVREDGHIMLTDFDLSLRCDVSPTLLKSSTFVMEPARISGPCTGSNCIDPFCIKPSCQVACFSPRILPTAAKARKQKSDRAAHMRLLPLLVAEPTEARSNSFVGTHEYLAPEIIKGEGHGSAVDWWTFGIFLYELLYGKTPFKGSGNEETLANVVMQSLRFPDTPLVSLQARDLIRGLLVKEPENRLGSQRGAADIKQHPFFEGLNWALIRCALPPELPSFSDYNYGFSSVISAAQGEDSKYLDCSATGDQLEFELF